MNQDLLLPLTVAGAVGLTAFVLYQWISGMVDGEKRKLAQRLSRENRPVERERVKSPVVRALEKTDRTARIINNTPILGGIVKMLPQVWPTVSLGKFFSITFGAGAVVFLIVWAVANNPLIGGGAGAVAAYIPYFLLSSKAAGRAKMLSDQLPEALDFLSRALRSGHSFSTGLQMISEELPEPLASEFRRTYDQHSLGQTVEAALRDTALRINSTEFSFFVTTVTIQRQTGGDMSEVLGNISEMIRARIRLQSHVKSKTAEGRFTGYILVAFPCIMFFICYTLNPGTTGLLLHGNGLWLLGIAVALCIAGLFSIRKLTQIRV
jgi:tight adherence protein B